MPIAHRYVKTSGNDNNSGTTEAAAWRTVGHAAAQDYSGNTEGTDIHVAPGVYRETVLADYPGAAGRVTRFLADPECLFFVNEKPGRVRLTGCDANEAPQAVYVVTSQKDYVEWHGFHLDGGSRGIHSSAGAGRNYFDCVLQARDVGIYSGSRVERCVAISGGYGYDGVGLVVANSIGIGASIGCRQATFYNCLGLGQFAFRSAPAYNCLALASQYGFYDCTGSRNLALACVYDTKSGNTTPTASYYVQTATAYLFGAGKQVIPDGLALLGLLPWQAEQVAGSLLRQGDNTTPGFGSSDTDIGRHRLRLKGSSLDIGPWSVAEGPDAPSTLLDWATYRFLAPSIKITAEGDVAFRLPAATTEITVRAWVRHDAITGSKPQIILTGLDLAPQTATATAGDGTWELLTVSATPTKTGTLTLILRARNSAGVCRFSDVSVTNARGTFSPLPSGALNPNLSGSGGVGFALGL